MFSQICLSWQFTFAYILLEFFGSKRLSFKNEDKAALAGESLSNLTQRAPQLHLNLRKQLSWVNSQVSVPQEPASSCVSLPNSPGTNPRTLTVQSNPSSVKWAIKSIDQDCGLWGQTVNSDPASVTCSWEALGWLTSYFFLSPHA